MAICRLNSDFASVLIANEKPGHRPGFNFGPPADATHHSCGYAAEIEASLCSRGSVALEEPPSV
jgi:hypothetical protein